MTPCQKSTSTCRPNNIGKESYVLEANFFKAAKQVFKLLTIKCFRSEFQVPTGEQSTQALSQSSSRVCTPWSSDFTSYKEKINCLQQFGSNCCVYKLILCRDMLPCNHYHPINSVSKRDILILFFAGKQNNVCKFRKNFGSSFN